MNRTLDSGRKPLHVVADFGQKEVMEFLISTGADVNVRDAAALTLVEMIELYRYVTFVVFVQATDKHGLTPLICACLENHVACVKLLLEKVGALISACMLSSL